MMRKITAMVLSSLAIATHAVGDTRYVDPASVLQELEQFREECARMADGEVRQEIFGIEIRRSGTICTVGPGEVDMNLVEFFGANQVSWAGLQNNDTLWVSIED